MDFNSYIIADVKTALSFRLTTPKVTQNKNKPLFTFGFTLAETLITLTIIGVVAAITIPTLYANYLKHTYVVGLKKAYSALQQAFKMIPITENCPAGDFECAGWNTTAENNIYLLSKQFKTQKVSDKNYSPSNMYSPHLVTQDGMVFFSNYCPNDGCYINVDINGTKGPNEWGRDFFRFYVPNDSINGIQAYSVLPTGSKAHYEYWSSCYGINSNIYWKTASTWSPYDHATGRVLEEDAMNY